MDRQTETFIHLLKKSKDADLLMAVDWVLDNGGNIEGVVNFCEVYLLSARKIRMKIPVGAFSAYLYLIDTIEPFIHPSIMADDYVKRTEWIMHKLPDFARERLTGTRNGLLMCNFIHEYRNETTNNDSVGALIDDYLLHILSVNKIEVLELLRGGHLFE